MTVEYAAFGDMTVSVDGVPHPLTRRREREVLAVLLVAHGRPVAAERLVAEVWGEDAAGQTAAPLHVVVSRLRSLLEPDRTARSGTRLVSTAAGYSLRAERADVDTWDFEAYLEAAWEATDPAGRLAGCERALAKWAGLPYAGSDAPSVRSEADRLAELYLTLQEQRARALLDLGRADEARQSLAEVVTGHPYREGMWSLLALAQYQSSRQADALATLRTLRTALADELGVDPLPETRQLEEAMLRQDHSLQLVAKEAVPGPTSAAVGPEARVGATPSTASIGRADVLEQIVGIHRAAVEDPGFRVVLVAGEAGIGKSQLVADLVRSVTQDGTRTVVGQCPEGEYAPPFWPWLRIVRPLADDALAQGAVDPLLEPLLAGEPPAGDAGSGATLRMFDAVVDLLGWAADQSPLLVVLEDLHWADESSLLLLRHLVASPPGKALTVLCTRRTTEARTGDALVDTMAAMARAGAERFRLDGLGVDSVRTLLDRWVGPHDTRLDGFVADVTAGNPFFVLQYGRLLAATPDLADLDPAELPVPDGVRDVLRQRVARLPDDAARLLASASVLGRDIDPDLLAELTGTPLDACLDALDLALASGLLEESQAGYAFAHALARDTLYADHSAARRMRLHDAAGRLVERRRRDDPDAVAEIAHHAHVAAPLGAEHAERACTWLAGAAEVAVSRYAHPEALDLWQRVLSDTSPRSLTAARAYRGIAAALIPSGRMVEAHDALDSAVTIASEHDDWTLVAQAATVLIRSGAWSWRALGSAYAPLVEVLTAAVPHVEPALQAQLLAILQMEHFHALQSDLVEEYGRRSVELARGVGDPALLREVLMLRLIGSTGSWDAGARRELVEELLGLAPDGELAVTTLFHLGQVLWDCGDPAG
ncbi:MAG TPA: BTAD domain-containing putative transcriptional regulator, partial [Nocardioides sp.]|nr:BTAD domain-containing putative transcriptional regulator [Nocardioides sp.]